MRINIFEGILIPFVGTTIGSACVFFMRQTLNKSVQRALAGFAAGIMVAASIWSLLIPAIKQSENMGTLSFVPAVVGFWIGILFLLALDHLIPHLHVGSDQAEVRILGELPNDDIYDFVLLTVRENQLYEALIELKNNKSNTIVTMINSLDSYNKWEDIVGKGRILPAFPGAGGSINDDGILDAALTPRLIQPTTFAEISGNKSERTKQFSEILRHAHIPYQKVTDMHLWQLCHLAMVVPIADAYYESDDPEKVGKEWKIMRKTAERMKRNFNFLRKQKGKLSPWKMNIFRFLPLSFLTIMLAVTFGSSFGDKFMYQHAMKAPDEMRELHKQFYAYMKKMKKCGCKAKKAQ